MAKWREANEDKLKAIEHLIANVINARYHQSINQEPNVLALSEAAIMKIINEEINRLSTNLDLNLADGVNPDYTIQTVKDLILEALTERFFPSDDA